MPPATHRLLPIDGNQCQRLPCHIHFIHETMNKGRDIIIVETMKRRDVIALATQHGS